MEKTEEKDFKQAMDEISTLCLQFADKVRKIRDTTDAETRELENVKDRMAALIIEESLNTARLVNAVAEAVAKEQNSKNA